jgi:hypothetical protein
MLTCSFQADPAPSDTFSFQYYLSIPAKKLHCSQKLNLPMSTTNNTCRDSITEIQEATIWRLSTICQMPLPPPGQSFRSSVCGLWHNYTIFLLLLIFERMRSELT